MLLFKSSERLSNFLRVTQRSTGGGREGAERECSKPGPVYSQFLLCTKSQRLRQPPHASPPLQDTFSRLWRAAKCSAVRAAIFLESRDSRSKRGVPHDTSWAMLGVVVLYCGRRGWRKRTRVCRRPGSLTPGWLNSRTRGPRCWENSGVGWFPGSNCLNFLIQGNWCCLCPSE